MIVHILHENMKLISLAMAALAISIFALIINAVPLLAAPLFPGNLVSQGRVREQPPSPAMQLQLPPQAPKPAVLQSSSGNIFLAWISNDTGHSNVLFAKSADAGKTFSKTVFLNSPNNGKTLNANVFTAVIGNNLYVTWWTNKGSPANIFKPVVRVSNDNGATFGKIIMLNSSSTTAGSVLGAGAPIVAPKVQQPVIGAPLATSDNNVYMAWPSNSTGHWNVLFAKSADAGKTFKTLYVLSSPNNGKTADFGANIGASGSHVFVYWWTNKTGKFEPVFRASDDYGNTFANIIRLNSTSGGISK